MKGVLFLDMQDKNFQYDLEFGSRSNEKFQDVYDEFIAADIAEAQAHLHELPENQRRGLTLDTLRHFGCGYLSKWINSKLRAKFVCGKVNEKTGKPIWLPPPSERIIIPTPSMNHFNAVATLRARRTMDKDFWKQHAGDMELFCDPDALKADNIVLVEGEIDAMSIWQATQGKVPVAAILGCTNSSATLGKRLRGDLKGKRFVILFDADAPGKKAAKKFQEKLIKERVPAVIRYLYTYLLPVDKKPPQAIHIDANELLQYHGAGQLMRVLNDALGTATSDLDKIAAQIEKEIAAAGTEDAGANIKVTSTARVGGMNLKAAGWDNVEAKTPNGSYRDTDFSQRQARFVSDTDARDIIITALKYVKARDLDRAEWFAVGCVLKRYGFDLADFDRWSNDGDDRYSAESCATQWHSMKSPDELSEGAGYKIGTLIKLAKTYSKEFSLLFSKPANATAPAQDSTSYSASITKTDFNADDTDAKPSNAEQIQAESAPATQDSIPARNSAIPDDIVDDTAAIAAAPAIDETTAIPSNAEQIQEESAPVTQAATPERNFAIPDDTDAKLKEWQAQFGDIDPRYMPNIKQAQEFLQNVTTDNLTVDKALSLQTKNALAISKFYSFLEPLFNRFFVVIEQKKRAAVNKLQINKLDGGGLIADDTDAIAWKNFSVRELKNAVDKIVRAIAKTHKDFRQAEKRRIAEEQNLARQNARDAATQENLKTLYELRDAPPSPARDWKMRELIKNTVEWKVNQHGERIAINNTAANLHTIFTFDPELDRLIGYDKFQGVVTFRKQAPWRDEACVGDEWSDRDDAQLRLYLRTNYPEFRDDKLIADAIVEYSQLYGYHEVKEMLNNMPKWDGIERAATLFIKFLGAKDTPYNRMVTMNWLMGLFARLYFPGCDYQNCLVLQGGQRIGKSRLLIMIAGGFGVNPRGKSFHVSIVDSLDDSHVIDAIQKAWVVELEEGVAISKADVRANKRFISASSDTRRFAYGKHAVTIKRHCVIAITTNNDMFLRDTTGNGRYYVIQCTNKNFSQVDGMTPQYIRQVLAEVKYKFDELFAGVDEHDTNKIAELLRLPLEFQVQNDQNNAAFMQDDGMMSETLAWLDQKIPPPVIWDLFTRDERAQFCRNGKIFLPNAKTDLAQRRKLRNNYRRGKDIHEIYAYLNNADYCRPTEDRGDDTAGFIIYGSEFRQHVCPAEILNEAFAPNDRRKNTARINELFSALKCQGWHEGKIIARDPVYKRQNKVLWRDNGNIPYEPEPANDDYDFGGEPLDMDDVPFDPNDLPI